MPGETTQVILVTGAANGIGYATARLLCDRGNRVMFADLDAQRANDLITKHGLGARAASVPVDVAESASVDEMIKRTVDEFGCLDVLVNNAGVPGSHDPASITDDEWSGMLDVHLSGMLRCARRAFPELSASHAPAIINMSSVAGLVGMPGRVAYSAAKAGVGGLTRTLAVEWAPFGIRVNAVAPGYVRTEGFDRRLVSADPSVVGKLSDEVPLGRLCRPEEVASVVHFLASHDSSYVSGQVMVVDGAMTIQAKG